MKRIGISLLYPCRATICPFRHVGGPHRYTHTTDIWCKNRLTPLIDSHDREYIRILYRKEDSACLIEESKEILPLKYPASIGTDPYQSMTLTKTETTRNPDLSILPYTPVLTASYAA